MVAVLFDGDSRYWLSRLPTGMNFIYLDGSRKFSVVLHELEVAYNNLARGGLLAGHDYDQEGVAFAVATLAIDPRFITGSSINLSVEPCRDHHPGYPSEYVASGFPLDWWLVKEPTWPEKIVIKRLRNG